MKIRLEERGRNHDFLRMIQCYVNSLPGNQPLCVPDLGCGAGVVIRQLVKRLHASSRFHGADISKGLLGEAAKLSTESSIEWDFMDSGTLPYSDETFDVITMHTLLSHVSDPISLLSEARRVLKKNGQLIIFDADQAGTTYNQGDYEASRRHDFLLTSAIATHPDICRQLPRLLKTSGYTLSNHDVDVISECGKGDYWLSSVEDFARLLPSTGALSKEDADTWVRFMLQSHAEDTFFASGAFYTVYAQRA